MKTIKKFKDWVIFNCTWLVVLMAIFLFITFEFARELQEFLNYYLKHNPLDLRGWVLLVGVVLAFLFVSVKTALFLAIKRAKDLEAKMAKLLVRKDSSPE